MTERVKYRPFTGDGEQSIRLDAAPLELVLCQVRWPELSFLQEERLRPIALQFGEAILDYPIFSEAKEISYAITPEGVTQNVVGSVFQWASVDQCWHVSLARRFVTLYATTYTNYAEFDERLRSVLENVRELLKVPVVERVGVRCVNRISDDATLAELPQLISPQVLGYQGLPIATGLATLQASNNQATYAVDDCHLQVRSGMVASGETVDPAIPPLEGRPSWVLDLDASNDRRWILDSKAVADQASHLSDIAYDYFKLVVTEGFVERFGAAR